MRKVLVVGCGGAGGATLSYLMDELRSEFALKGIDRIPEGWQFLHLDVPAAAHAEAPGVPSVADLGGTYYGLGDDARGTYSLLDSAISEVLAQSEALSSIATWAPRDPAEVMVPIAAPAGIVRWGGC